MKTRLAIITLTLAASAAAAAAQQGGRPFTIQMTGALEKPGPGDTDGSGTATFRVNPGQGQVCYTLTAQNIDPANAAHIHRTPPDPGPVAIPLTPPTNGSSEGCATADREVLQELIRSPSSFYVNVHNAPFPKGAIRGNFER